MSLDRLFFGILTGVFAFVGLLMASRAADAGTSIFGLALFLFGVLFIFGLIGSRRLR